MADDAPLIAVLDYGIGNLHSAHKGFAAVGGDTRLTADHGLIADADGVVLPGVGAFGPCMRALDTSGLVGAALDRIEAGVPFFGICVGMQMLYANSEESPGVDGLGVFAESIERIPEGVKHPQMQWNVLEPRGDHPMFASLPAEAWMYFVHSYAAADSSDVIATCDYGGPVTAAAAKDNVWAAQFHPEKSGRNGLQILRNFVDTAAARRGDDR